MLRKMASVAEIIHVHRDEIMKLWLARARDAASARALSAAALENAMPTYLSALADQIETGQLDANGRRQAGVRQHLAARLREGFDLAEIVEEFGLLEQCIAVMWRARPQEEWPSLADVERLHLQIQLAITEVVDTYRRHMLDDEQSEKRYRRLLETIANEALRGDEPLRERLREVLDIIVEAIGAQCAMYVAYDVPRAQLVLVGSTGNDALPAYAASLDLGSEPAHVAEVESTKLEVPQALRSSGIHALLGVRLPKHRDLVEVLYVGNTESREFTSREIARLGALGERLSLHLENARLFAALHDQIESLAVERSLRERFVSTLAHDLRGPLSAARLAAELLALQPASLDQRRDLALKVDHNIARVDHMIRDLLDANRIRAGERLPLRLDTCDMVALAHRVAEEARAMHGDRFSVDADCETLRGIWSEEELHRALWNLVTNAVKYGAPKQPITLTVERRAHLARVSVHNLGTPIPAADRAHIFDAYARTRSADASDRAGWGLGLTLVRGVAEAHGGDVSVASDAESGTTFTIELPLDARAERDNAEAPTVH